MVEVPPELAEAYRACERLARAHYENFPVASLLLPKRMRPHVAAVYAFARTADDFADEGDRNPAEREALLDEWDRQVGSDPAGVSFPRSPGLAPVLAATAHTIRACRLPVALFHDLVSAFRQDVRVTRYGTWRDVLDYCRRSANPVGRLVLRIGGYDDPVMDREADAICTALQLTNFWQDLAADWDRGRLYVPAEELSAAGASEADLDRRRLTPEWRAVLQRVGKRTRAVFDAGRGLPARVRGRLGWELRVTWLGGVRILDRLERRGFDVFDRRPMLSLTDAPSLMWRAIAWRPSRSGSPTNAAS